MWGVRCEVWGTEVCSLTSFLHCGTPYQARPARCGGQQPTVTTAAPLVLVVTEVKQRPLSVSVWHRDSGQSLARSELGVRGRRPERHSMSHFLFKLDLKMRGGGHFYTTEGSLHPVNQMEKKSLSRDQHMTDWTRLFASISMFRIRIKQIRFCWFWLAWSWDDAMQISWDWLSEADKNIPVQSQLRKTELS